MRGHQGARQWDKQNYSSGGIFELPLLRLSVVLQYSASLKSGLSNGDHSRFGWLKFPWLAELGRLMANNGRVPQYKAA